MRIGFTTAAAILAIFLKCASGCTDPALAPSREASDIPETSAPTQSSSQEVHPLVDQEQPQPPVPSQPPTGDTDGSGVVQSNNRRDVQDTLSIIAPSKFNLNVYLAEGWVTKRTFEDSITVMPRVLVRTIITYLTDERLPEETEQRGFVKRKFEQILIGITTWLSMGIGKRLTADEYISELFERLKQKRDRDGMCKLGKELGNHALVKYVYPTIVTTEHYKEPCEFMGSIELLSNFLVHGEMELVRRIIVGFSGPRKRFNHEISMALISSLHERDHYERFRALLSADEQTRKESGELVQALSLETDGFIMHFLSMTHAGRGSINASLKRFLALQGHGFGINYPITCNTLCAGLVSHFRRNLGGTMTTEARETLVDLVGQPNLLSSKAIIDGLLVRGSTHPENFLDFAWREGIEEFMNGEYAYGDRQRLWNAILERFSAKKLDPTFPPSQWELTRAIDEIPTKLMREEEWTAKNAPDFQRQLPRKSEETRSHLLPFFPDALITIILEYIFPLTTATWINIPAS